MNRILLLAVALVAMAGVAQAQPKQVVSNCGSGVTLSPGDGAAGTVDTTGRGCEATTTTSAPTTGNGSLATSTVSAAINTMTVSATGAALPATLSGFIARTSPTSTTDAALCVKGGTCTCPESGVANTNGITLSAGGGGYQFNGAGVASSLPTIVACSGTPGVEFQW